MVLSSPLASGTLGSQPRRARAWVMSGCRVCGSSTGSGLKTMGLELPTAVGIADVAGVPQVAHQQPPDPFDEVVDVAEGAGLLAGAEDSHGLAGEGLLDEGGNHPAVAHPHPRPIGVENAHDAHLQAVIPVIRHGHRLGEALGLVVDATRTDRVDVAPVGLFLRVLLGIAVDLGGGGEEEAGSLRLGQAEAVVGAERADLQGLDGQLEIVDGRGGRGEVEDEVDRALHLERLRDVVLQVLEALPVAEMGDVLLPPGEQIVDADHAVTLGEGPLAEVGAEEAGAARDDHPAHDRPPAVTTAGRTSGTPSGRPIEM